MSVPINPWCDPSKAPQPGLVWCSRCRCWVTTDMGMPEIVAGMRSFTGTPQEIAEEYCRRVEQFNDLRIKAVSRGLMSTPYLHQ